MSRLPKTANPVRWGELSARKMEAEIRVHREIYCPWYEKCLDLASLESWSGFTCHWCPLKGFRAEPKRVLSKKVLGDLKDVLKGLEGKGNPKDE